MNVPRPTPTTPLLDNRLDLLTAACTLIRARFTHMHKPAPGRLASFEAWDELVRQSVVWVDGALAPGPFGNPTDLVREAQAADPEVDAPLAVLDALRDQFGTAALTAKDLQARADGSITQRAMRDDEPLLFYICREAKEAGGQVA